MPSAWSRDPCWPKDNKQYQAKLIIPGTSLWLHQQPPQSSGDHWASRSSSALHEQAPRYRHHLLDGVKELCILTHLLNHEPGWFALVQAFTSNIHHYSLCTCLYLPSGSKPARYFRALASTADIKQECFLSYTIMDITSVRDFSRAADPFPCPRAG